MASEFIGYNVLVTLREPHGGKLVGQVANVFGQRLLLQDVTFFWNGQRLPQYSIDASAIIDLSLETNTQAPSQRQQLPQHQINPQLQPYAAMPLPPAPTQSTPTQQQFNDPAILSFSKAPLVSNPFIETASTAVPANQIPGVVSASLRTSHKKLPRSPQELSPLKQTPKRNRRGNQENIREERGYVAKHGAAASTNPKSKGWRQTAFVEPAAPALQDSPEARSRSGIKLRKKKSRRYAEDPSGWATEDATDIQELGEFDFESNLSKFDKRTVFEQIRNDDTTADEERLVSFNRKVKPGTNGGKNLHWTENVLDSPQNSDTGDDIEGMSEIKLSSDTLSTRERSRAPTHTQPPRKDSAIQAPPMVPQLSALGRSQLHVNISRTTSPRPSRSSVSPMIAPNVSGSGCLRLTTTNRSCPTVSPLQTLEIEQISVAEFGLADEIITENAGRGIAEAAVALLSNDAAAPTLLILTGNHRTGARAIAAARHLRNRGHRVTVCLLGLEHEAELLENCRKQLDIFRKVGGRVLKWEDLSARLATSDLGPDLIIDALFGIHLSFDDLRTDDQGVAFEMISWINRSNVDVLSVDVPSGLNASTGEVTLAEGGRLCVNATSVVCLGAPKTGVLNALLSGERLSWNLAVADIGIPQIVWRKYGTRRRHGIDFGNKWVVPLKYQPLLS
ncbi:NAD(P)H-hydrate epimerase [Penicillium digitatum]|uniref:NAD(P)H-hydrate epimerase n=1 Tax=Penicillium digitatum TaxID=36651 RepID=A0A7T6XFY2_PENDI|nr:NAD(P)H-hydrate epimerase [Penicillium digitatum]